MKKNQEVSRREKSAAVGLVICFVAMIAIVGMVTFGRYERKSETELARVEEKQKDVQEEETQITNGGNVQSEVQEEVLVEAPEIVIPEATDAVQQLVFSASDTLIWPVEGNVILNYSMDQTIYFSTLDQYKYNPALVISSEIGDEVLSAAAGEIISIQNNAQTGMTVKMNIGSGYEIIYGQLKDICVQEGDKILQGDLIGYVSEPTKYYSVEGPNVYFQLLKDGESVNPMEYLAD